MSSTIIAPLAEALAGLADGITVNGKALKGVWPPRMGLPDLPCVEIEVPERITRTEPDEAESQIGSEDWHIDFTATIYFDLREPVAAQLRLIEALELWIAAVDADRSLGAASTLDASVVSAERVYPEDDQQRSLIAYATTVRVWRLV
jgi:hypothetical protein